MIPNILTWAGMAAALVYFAMTEAKVTWLRSGVKTLPLVLFAAAAFAAGAPVLLTLGLGLSAVGDFALSRQGQRAFLAGLIAFALAHVAFIVLFLDLSQAPLWAAFGTQTALAVMLIVLWATTELWLLPHTGRLAWPVRAYVVAIMLMGLAALTLGLGLVAAGALLFILSDLVLAIRLFRMSDDAPLEDIAGWLVWAFYIAGQSMILTGAA